MANVKDTRVGVIGLGGMGQSHATQILEGKVPGFKLAAIADLLPDRRQFKADEQTLLRFEDGAACIASGELDAIIIATPHLSHPDLAIQGLEAGLHVLVEKPMAIHKAESERMIAAYQGKDQLVFAEMLNQRTDPLYIRIRKLIQDGELGAIHRIGWTITNWFRSEIYYSQSDWRATWAGEGGGVLLNQCPHQLDLWQWLFGMPQSIRAFCQFGRFHNIETEDDVTAYMEYADGASGVFITTTGDAPGVNRLEISAENGHLVAQDNAISFRRNTEPSQDFALATQGPFAAPECWDVTIPVEGVGEQHLGILKNFSAAIREDAELIGPAVEGIKQVELSNAMLYSTFTDSTVTLPLDSATYAAALQEKTDRSDLKGRAVVKQDVDDDFSKSF